MGESTGRSPRAANYSSPFDLTGRAVLITGASRGLGAAMAAALSDAGADLILWARDSRRLARQAKLLTRAHPSCRILSEAVDVTHHAQVRRAVRNALRHCGRIDVLINNAGVWGGDEALRLDRGTWDRVLETDLTSVFFVSQTVVSSMIKQRYGKIITVASTAGLMALPHGAAYGTVKAALLHLTRILAVEWSGVGTVCE